MYCPPFDHQDVIDGNASMVHEIVEQMNGQVPDGIVCCVGGGGLIGGIFKGKVFASKLRLGLKMVKQARWKNGSQSRFLS